MYHLIRGSGADAITTRTLFCPSPQTVCDSLLCTSTAVPTFLLLLPSFPSNPPFSMPRYRCVHMWEVLVTVSHIHVVRVCLQTLEYLTLQPVSAFAQEQRTSPRCTTKCTPRWWWSAIGCRDSHCGCGDEWVPWRGKTSESVTTACQIKYEKTHN